MTTTRNAIIVLSLLQLAFAVFAILAGAVANRANIKVFDSDSSSTATRFLQSKGWLLLLVPVTLFIAAESPVVRDRPQRIKLTVMVVVGVFGIFVILYYALGALEDVVNVRAPRSLNDSRY